jgi:hypothetical protein
MSTRRHQDNKKFDAALAAELSLKITVNNEAYAATVASAYAQRSEANTALATLGVATSIANRKAHQSKKDAVFKAAACQFERGDWEFLWLGGAGGEVAVTIARQLDCSRAHSIVASMVGRFKSSGDGIVVSNIEKFKHEGSDTAAETKTARRFFVYPVGDASGICEASHTYAKNNVSGGASVFEMPAPLAHSADHKKPPSGSLSGKGMGGGRAFTLELGVFLSEQTGSGLSLIKTVRGCDKDGRLTEEFSGCQPWRMFAALCNRTSFPCSNETHEIRKRLSTQQGWIDLFRLQHVPDDELEFEWEQTGVTLKTFEKPGGANTVEDTLQTGIPRSPAIRFLVGMSCRSVGSPRNGTELRARQAATHLCTAEKWRPRLPVGYRS